MQQAFQKARFMRFRPGFRANLILRGFGLALLVAPVMLTRWLYGLRHALPPHPVSLWEFLIAFAAIVLLWLANIALMAGDNLLRVMPRPRLLDLLGSWTCFDQTKFCLRRQVGLTTSFRAFLGRIQFILIGGVAREQ